VLRIERYGNGKTIYRLIGHMKAENATELQALIEAEGKKDQIVLDLRDLTLVDRDAVEFLGHCETKSIRLADCPAYIREWIERERNASR